MSRSRFGVIIPGFQHNGNNGAEFADQIVNFLRVLDGDFESVWICDHFFPWLDSVNKTAPALEGFTTISYLSALFPKFTFGNTVLCNSYRNPALLAKMVATLQTLTAGRVVLGIGAGWKQDEHMAFGYDFPSSKARIHKLEDAVQIIKQMWTKGFASFKSSFYEIEAYCYPKPSPTPPIMIGGAGEKFTLRAVARHSDWWNIQGVSPEQFGKKLKVLEEHCRRENRSCPEIVKTLSNAVAISKKREEAWRLAVGSPFTRARERSEKNRIIGSADEVVEKLQEYASLGVDYFILRFLDFPQVDGVKLFVKEVLPSFSVSRA